jgi:5-methylcytosine-specific restriction endonuclease McrA
MKRSAIGPRTYEAALERRIALQASQREKAALSSALARGKPITRKSSLSQRPRRVRNTADGDSARDIKLECDQLVREIIALRDKKCFTCPRREDLEVGHLIRPGIESVRWDLENCNAQCPRCNSRHEERPEIYEHEFLRRFGGIKMGKLLVRASYRGKLTYTELSAIRDNLRDMKVFYGPWEDEEIGPHVKGR